VMVDLFEKQKKEYREFFCEEKGLQKLRDLALSGTLSQTGIRSISWRVFLGCLPKDLPHKEWPQVLNIHRKEYTALLSQYLIDPHESAKELDPIISNPLSQSEESLGQVF